MYFNNGCRKLQPFIIENIALTGNGVASCTRYMSQNLTNFAPDFSII